MNESEPTSDRPPRRPRYRGTHPRAFGEKYKEHQPDRYADDVAKILADGKTPAGSHRSIMVPEILQVLAPKSGDLVVDCTLGYGGHAAQILSLIQPTGRLLGLDVDPIELPKTEQRLIEQGTLRECLTVRRSNFAGLARVVGEVFPEGVDCLLADLGVSSMQLDDPARGFTFKTAAPLDMRMNPQHGQSVATLLSKIDESKLAALLTENADEPYAGRLALAIVNSQKRQPIATTTGLVEVIRTALEKINCSPEQVSVSIRRVFQALRIAVNDEFGALDALLKQIPTCLRPGGRVAILTFHSGEDRRVKHAFKAGLRDGIYASISEDVLRPSLEEQRSNPRSTSAKLRYATRQ